MSDATNTQTTVQTTNTAPALAPFDPTKTYAAGDKFSITFDGKTINVAFVRPGVVQKTASIFYIRDVTTGQWLYCFPERLERLIKKGTDLANYKGRETKAAERKAAKVTALAQKKAREEAALKAAADAMARVQNAQPATPVAPAPVAPAPVEPPVVSETAQASTAPARVAAKKK